MTGRQSHTAGLRRRADFVAQPVPRNRRPAASDTYDALDRLTSRTTAGPAGTFEQGIAYNVSSLPLKVDYSALGSQWSITNTYAKTKQLRTRTAAGQTWDFSFAAAGQLSSAVSDVSLQTRSFDVYGRLEAVRDGRPSGSSYDNVLEAILTYDPKGRISSQQIDGGLGLYDATDTFSYDDASRMTGWQRSGTGATNATYSYDAACNITQATRTGATTAYAYDADNRLVSAVTGGVTTAYANDLYGRRRLEASGGSAVAYDWDALGHLVSVRSEEATITYAYGISGMRELVSVEASGEAARWTESVWDGSQLAAERDSDGTRYTYVWGPERTPLALEVVRPGQAAVTYAYHTDALGSVVAITSPSGVVVASYAYDPYGALTQVGGSDAALAGRNPLRYRAYYHDTTTGHYYLPARYYDPDAMRFLSPDPAPPSAGDPLSLNRYAYCVGDPVDLSDPTGEIADIWREHPGGVTVGMKVMTSVAAAKSSGATGWDASYAKHSHLVTARVLTAPGSVRPSYRMGATGWEKPAGYDSWQTEWLRQNDWWAYQAQRGKFSFSRSLPEPEDLMWSTVSVSLDGIKGCLTAGGAEASAAGLGSASVAAPWAIAALGYAGTVVGSYRNGEAIARYFWGPATAGDLVWALATPAPTQLLGNLIDFSR